MQLGICKSKGENVTIGEQELRLLICAVSISSRVPRFDFHILIWSENFKWKSAAIEAFVRCYV
jgi:hypothetical protein